MPMEKAFWASIVNTGFAVPDGYRTADLLPDLLAGLGSTDPELRDRLCYEILDRWVEDGRFASGELRALSSRLQANLEAGVGEGENDLVFLRTFSVLILGTIVHSDAQKRFLTPAELDQIQQAGLRYLAREQDVRGYVPEKGWAHSVAHTADLLRFLAAHPLTDAAGLERILEGIAAKVLAPTPASNVTREGFRLGRAVVAVLQRDLLPPARVVAWAQTLGAGVSDLKAFGAGQNLARSHNTDQLLTALHVLLTYQEVPEAMRAELLATVHRVMQSYMRWLR